MRMGDNVEGQRPQHSKDPDVRERGGQGRRVMLGLSGVGRSRLRSRLDESYSRASRGRPQVYT